MPMRLKVETNTREHFALHGFQKSPFKVASRWFEGACAIPTYELDELLGTKLRALYQRKKGRDLFDLARRWSRPGVDPARVVQTFSAYMEHEGHPVTRAQFEENMHLNAPTPFTADIGPLSPGLCAGIWRLRRRRPLGFDRAPAGGTVAGRLFTF